MKDSHIYVYTDIAPDIAKLPVFLIYKFGHFFRRSCENVETLLLSYRFTLQIIIVFGCQFISATNTQVQDKGVAIVLIVFKCYGYFRIFFINRIYSCFQTVESTT